MAFYNCTVHTATGEIVCTGVRVNVEQPDASRGDWYGTITVTHVNQLLAGERYRMSLDDGRSGEFVVRRNTFAGGEDRAVAINGLGPLQRA